MVSVDVVFFSSQQIVAAAMATSQDENDILYGVASGSKNLRAVMLRLVSIQTVCTL